MEAEAGDLTQTTPGLLSTSAAGEAGAVSGADNTDNYADTDKAVTTVRGLGLTIMFHCIALSSDNNDTLRSTAS